MKLPVYHKSLTFRYLLWAYKTTRESFERIERKTTQLKVDEHILETLNRALKIQELKNQEYQKQVAEFEQYIVNKENDEIKIKFSDGNKKSLHPQYLYLRNRLFAIEEAIQHFLGPKELKKIEALFEQEFIDRILKAKEH
ncbi:MAG: hypothetical protein WCH62_05725 [Candidatus Omnitrophota bacterium]